MPWLAVPYDATRMRHQQISMRYGFQGNVIAIEEALWINVIRHDKKKPGGLDKVLKHFGIDDPAKICIIGDRLLIDVVFGNLYGMIAVHTLLTFTLIWGISSTTQI